MRRLLVKKKYTNLSGGHWVTITKPGPLHGRHIYIDSNGTILAGNVPKEYHGKKLSELHHDAPHPELVHAHEIASNSSEEDLHDHIHEAEENAKISKDAGSAHGETFWNKKKDIANHHLGAKEKEDHVEKRPIPDTAPHLSKKPIHNTYSKKTPAELKALIAAAKANIASGNGNGYDKKVINIASYYLNGGQMPDDSMFGPKGKKEKEAPAPVEETKEEEAPKKEEPKYSGPHQEYGGLHATMHDKNKEQLEEYQDMTMNDIKESAKSGDSDMLGKQKQKLDIVNHYLEQKGGSAKQYDPKETAPHQGKYPLTHKAVEDGDPDKIKDKQNELVGQMNTHIDNQNQAYHKVAGEKLEIANHYASHNGLDIAEAPEYKRPVPTTAPHPTYETLHNQLNKLSFAELKELIAKQKEKIAGYKGTPAEDSIAAGHAQRKLDIASYYLNGGKKPQHFGPHTDMDEYHEKMKAKNGFDLIEGQDYGIDALEDPNKVEKYYENKKKLEIIQHYMIQKGVGGDIKPIPDHPHFATHVVLDDFSNPNHELQTDNYEHTGKNISQFGIDHSDPNQVHSWNSPIEHYAKGFTGSEMKSTAKKLMSMIEDGDEKTGKTDGNPVTAKKKVQSNLGNALMHNDHFMEFTKALKQHNGFEDGVGPLDMNDPATRKEHSLAAAKTIISKWAGTSADHDPLAIAVQLAAKEEFGLNMAYEGFHSDTVAKAHDKYLNDPKVKAGLKAFIREQYNQTQSYFKANGITHVPIMRGMGFSNTDPVKHIPEKQAVKTKVHLQPLSSFSASSGKAHQFTGSMGTGGGGPNKLMIGAMVPVERILGLPQTGYGCMGEHEYVVLGQSHTHDDFVAYHWKAGNGDGGFYHGDIFEHMEKLGQDVPKPKDPSIIGKDVAGQAKVGGKLRGGSGKDNGNGTHDFTFSGTHNGEKGTHTVTVPSHHFAAHDDEAGQQALAPKPKAEPKTKVADKKYHYKSPMGGYYEASNAKHVPNEHGIDAFVHKTSNGYKVSEGSTGVPITGTYKTQKTAVEVAHGIMNGKKQELTDKIAKHPAIPHHMLAKSFDEDDSEGIVQADADLNNADWTKQSWDLPDINSPEFEQTVQGYGGMSHFKTLPVYKHYVAKKKRTIMKKKTEYNPSDRHAYRTHTRNPIYLPLNRLKTPYQTDEALDEDKIKENVKRIKNGEALAPVIVGYDYDLHDGHHRLEAAKRVGHSHIPCVVGGRNKRRSEAADKRYRAVYKSESTQDSRLLVKGTPKEVTKRLILRIFK